MACIATDSRQRCCTCLLVSEGASTAAEIHPFLSIDPTLSVLYTHFYYHFTPTPPHAHYTTTLLCGKFQHFSTLHSTPLAPIHSNPVLIQSPPDPLHSTTICFRKPNIFLPLTWLGGVVLSSVHACLNMPEGRVALLYATHVVFGLLPLS